MNKPMRMACVSAGLCSLASMVTLAADDDLQHRTCAVHAAAMVAEMKASSASPLSEQELGLVRQTALKSCLAQAKRAVPAASPAQAAALSTAPAPAPAPAPATRDTSFWGTLKPILGGDSTRKAGNERLFRRGRY